MLTALAVLLFVLTSALKITLFNHILVPGADKWMFRFKLLTTLPLLIIAYPILFRLRSRVLFITFYVIQTLYILINMSYYMYFNNYLHLEQFITNFYEGFIAVMNASAPKNPVLLIALIDLPFFIFLAIYYKRANDLRKKLRLPVNIAVALALIVTVYTQYGHYKENIFITHLAKSTRLGESLIVSRYGTLANNIVGMYKHKDTQEYINSLSYGREIARKTEREEKADIFIIQVESLESAIVQQTHGGSYVMPYLRSLTQSSVYYPYMLNYHFGGGTSDSEFSIINSVEPLLGYPAIKLSSYNSPNSFIKRLKESSYEAYAFHGNVGRYYNRDIAFRSFGFDEFYDIAEMGMADVGWGAPDDKVFGFALDKAAAAQGPVLSYVITMSSHGPFTNVLNYYHNSLFDDIQDKKLKDYYNSMAYVDKCIKDYVESIRDRYDDAYIFIFGDHPPQINNSGFNEASLKMNDRTYEFVPLFIITPDNMKYSEQEYAASFLDIAPTVLNASGAPYSILSDGADLLDPDKKPGNIPHRGLLIDRAELYEKIADIVSGSR